MIFLIGGRGFSFPWTLSLGAVHGRGPMGCGFGVPQNKFIHPFFRTKLLKKNRYQMGCSGGGAGYSPSFGTFGPSPSPSGVIGLKARILEFSSPQIAILTPNLSPTKRKPSLALSPVPPPSR